MDDDQFLEWLRSLRERRLAEVRAPRRGTLEQIGRQSVLRGRNAIVRGQSVALGRTIPSSAALCGDRPDRPTSTPRAASTYQRDYGPLTLGYDFESDCHSIDFTHMDALSHLAVDDEWHTGESTSETRGPSIADWSTTGISTRAVLVDLPSYRGTDFVERGRPVTAHDVDEALKNQDVEFVPGDALLLYLGRDRLESEHSREPHPAVSQDVCRWIVDRGVSVLCWDLSDAPTKDRRKLTVHLLIWAVGLAIVDNCDFSRAVRVARSNSVWHFNLTIGPLPIAGATGSHVNPVLTY